MTIEEQVKVLTKHLTYEELVGYIKGNIFCLLLNKSEDNTVVNANDVAEWANELASLQWCKHYADDINQVIDESKVSNEDCSNVNPYNVKTGDYVRYFDFYEDKEVAGIVTALTSFSNGGLSFRVHVPPEDRHTAFHGDTDTMLEHIPKLEKGKWYDAREFDKDVLQMLLPEETPITVLTDINKDKMPFDDTVDTYKTIVKAVGSTMSGETAFTIPCSVFFRFWFKIIDQTLQEKPQP